MSDPKLISPLLDGFALGNPISNHDGVSCCPAIKENSDKKYIVKIITVPESQTQIDALLLAGAYRDPAGAMEYYRVIGEEIMKEAELLTILSKLDGFLPYEGWQMEPITKRRLGYEVYLVGSYKRSLEKYVRRNPVTHLEAINLALDMCSALAVCRQAGSLYVDLKPQNIFMSDKKEYRIGDLGFVSMDALSYSTLPDKYRSQYTPPELYDPMVPLNLTVDTYAIGMILYQLYNDGQLPFQKMQPEEGLSSPMNADYELSEIIMKAIHLDPSQRWQDPQQMGRALVDYMQRNTVNDVPITPHTPLEVKPEDIILPKVTSSEPSEAPSPAGPETEPHAPVPEDTPVPAIPVDETLPGEEDAESLLPHEMSDELSHMIAKADDLLNHEIPEEVLAPDVPAPEDPFGFVAVNPEDVDDSDIPYDPPMDESLPDKKKEKKPARSFVTEGGGSHVFKRLLTLLIVLLVLAGIGAGLLWGYRNYYVKSIDGLIISGDQEHLTVQVDTQVEEGLLTVTCADNYGNIFSQPLRGGTVTFSDLLPNTMYKIQIEIEGFHTLTGKTSDVFTTEATTRILGFSAITGTEDGSVLLNFTSDGEEPNMWTLVYGAEGEETLRKNFEGHSVTLNGLSIGKQYTFTLEADNGISLSGEKSIQYVASRLILAQNLTVNSSTGNDLSVSWGIPGDVLVDSWTVRCYSTNYDEQFTVTETEAYFTDIDPNISYTIEVIASGMTQAARVSITEDPITVTNVQANISKAGKLVLTWEHTGETPEDGWLVLYSIDGGDNNKSVVKADEALAEITPLVPDADYRFTIQAANSTTVFGGTCEYSSAQARDFSGNGLEINEITGYLLKTPSEEGWLFENVGSGAVTTDFNVGEPISVVLFGNDDIYMPGTDTEVMFVIRDAYGNALSQYVSVFHETWRDLWFPGDDHYTELNIPKVPDIPGNFTVEVFFNGGKMTALPFTIS